MNENAYQPFPRRGVLARNLNLEREELLERVACFMRDRIYRYVVCTVKHENNRLYQTGSGPNFQGGLVTLCSCKHEMRTYPAMVRDVWIAGFTSNSVEGKNWLFYLMRVLQTYKSHDEFWNSQSVSRQAKVAKAADRDKFGDVYRPRRNGDSPYSLSNYCKPCKNHVHREDDLWHKDISYTNRWGHRPVLLVGDPEYSFLWSEMEMSYPKSIRRSTPKGTLAELVAALL